LHFVCREFCCSLVVVGNGVLVCFLPRRIFMEEDVSCESAGDKLQIIADAFPCYFHRIVYQFVWPYGFWKSQGL